MKAIIFANVNGKFDTVNKILATETETQLAYCIGNFPVVSNTTPINQIFTKANTSMAKRAFKHIPKFPKVLYTLAGRYDDPFPDLKYYQSTNLFPLQQQSICNLNTFATKPMQGHNIPITRTVKVGFLGGYYSKTKFNTDTVLTNRKNQKRSHISLVLHQDDFDIFYKQLLKYLFTYESPSNCPNIKELIRQTQPLIHFHTRSRIPKIQYIDDTLSINIPNLDNGYYVVCLYSGNIIHKDVNGNHIETFCNEKQEILGGN